MTTTAKPARQLDIVHIARTKPVTLWADGRINVIGAWTNNKKTGRAYGISVYTDDTSETGLGAGCAECPLSAGRVCYVMADGRHHHQHKTRAAASHPALPRDKWRSTWGDDFVRLGVFGDPGMIPLRILRQIIQPARSWSGYTHHWRTIDTGYAGYLMASCETSEDVRLAESLGWNAFYTPIAGTWHDHRTRKPEVMRSIRRQLSVLNATIGPENRVICPAFASSGHVQCRSCDVGCRGNSSAFMVTNPSHGSGSNKLPGDRLEVIK